MKKLLIKEAALALSIAIVGSFGMGHYIGLHRQPTYLKPIVRRSWRCDDADMTRKKAQELLAEGVTYLDGDGDGKACEFLEK